MLDIQWLDSQWLDSQSLETPDNEWLSIFRQIPRSTILQSSPYARAMQICYGYTPHFGVITINNQPAGLVVLLTQSLFFGIYQQVILDRGPLWLEGFGGIAHIKAFFDHLHRLYPKRLGRQRRILPEIPHSPAAIALLEQTGIRANTKTAPYQTVWWDLSVSDDEAISRLSSSWQKSLKKAQKSSLSIEWDDKGIFYPWLKKRYTLDRIKRQYDGISPHLLDDLAQISTLTGTMIIGKITQGDTVIAALLFFLHGRSATYQIGWTSEQGRAACAHHFGLWQARSMLKHYGIYDLDLGGVNEQQSTGIQKFKTGTGGTLSCLIGHYH